MDNNEKEILIDSLVAIETLQTYEKNINEKDNMALEALIALGDQIIAFIVDERKYMKIEELNGEIKKKINDIILSKEENEDILKSASKKFYTLHKYIISLFFESNDKEQELPIMMRGIFIIAIIEKFLDIKLGKKLNVKLEEKNTYQYETHPGGKISLN